MIDGPEQSRPDRDPQAAAQADVGVHGLLGNGGCTVAHSRLQQGRLTAAINTLMLVCYWQATSCQLHASSNKRSDARADSHSPACG